MIGGPISGGSARTGLIKRRTLSGNTTLTSDDDGTFITGSAGGIVMLTTPAVPRPGYKIMIKPIINSVIVNFNGQLLHQAPGYGGHDYEIWTLPYYRENGYVTLEFDGTYWTLTGRSGLYYPKVNPLDCQDLAHGQVRFDYDGSTYFTLSQFNGPGGLLVDKQMHAISPTGLKYNKSGTTASALNYFYVGNSAANDITGIVDNGGGLCKVAFTNALSNCVVGDTVFVDLQGSKGCTEANGRWVGVVTTDTSHVVLTGSTFTNAWTSGGDGRIDFMFASVTAWAVDAVNGVKTMSGNTLYTLVGMAWVAGSNVVADSATKRDVASLFNQKWKTATNAFTTDRTTSSASDAEINSEIQTEFVTWGVSDARWAINATIKDGTNGAYFSIGAAFDGTVAEAERATILNAVGSNGTCVPACPTGNKSGLTEGKHYATVVGKTNSSSTGTILGTTPPVGTLEVSVLQ